MKTYVGIDLHSSNSYIGIIDQDRKKLFEKRFSNNPDDILNALAPFKKDIVGIVVESTYNWYWLVDTLDADELFACYEVALIAKNNIKAIIYFSQIIKSIEKEVLAKIKRKEKFQKLTTLPGIGNILGITIMLEVGDISRFKKPGNYSSYCRAVGSQRLSNGKKKGETKKMETNIFHGRI